MFNNSDKFDHMIALAAMKCAEEDARALNEIDTEGVSFDASYYRKRNRVINKCKRRSTVKHGKMVVIRIAAAIMIMVTLACVLIGCVPGLRQAIYNAIVEWYNEYFTVRYEDSNGLEKETGHLDGTTAESEVIAPDFIEDIRKPTNLPEGAWEDILTYNSTQIIVDYYVGEEYLFSFTQGVLNPSDKYVDNENVNVTYHQINGKNATAVEYIDKKAINVFWSDSEYSYQIFSTECDLDTLIMYAESVE